MTFHLNNSRWLPLLPLYVSWCRANGVPVRKVQGNKPWDKEDTGDRIEKPSVEERFHYARKDKK